MGSRKWMGKSVSGNYNYFGIKADSRWKGDKKLVTTREVFTPQQAQAFVAAMPGREIISQNGNNYVVKDWFRSYGSISEAVQDKVNFLKNNKRYQSAGVFDAKTPEEFFTALQKAGYATDPNYVKSGVAMASSVDKKLKTVASLSSPTPNTGSQIDSASKENKDLKRSTSDAPAPLNINNNTNVQQSPRSSQKSQTSDDKNAYQKKAQG